MKKELNEMPDGFIKTFICLAITFFVMQVFIACGSKSLKQEPVSAPKIEVPVVEQPKTLVFPLPMEKNHHERAAWSAVLFKLIDEKFESLDKAKDMAIFCPKYSSLSVPQKKIAWGMLWDSIIYYESGYNPKSQSVDVGSKSDKNTWSVGLTQTSVTDIANWKLPLKYTYKDLLEVEPNLTLALNIFAKQIDKQGLIVVPKSLYWAVIGPKGYKYTKVPQISAKVQALEFCK